MKKEQMRPLAIAVALGLSCAVTDVFAGRYVEGSGGITVNNYGECWRSAGGAVKMVEACGDVVAAPPAPAPMEKPRLDSDGDGVYDDRDKCPGTRAGAKVDSDGCEIIGNITINLVEDEFDFDSAVLKPGMKAHLNDVIKQVNSTPGNEHLSIIGHTDSVGPDAYNQGLSERRAQSVADYLANGGVSASQMATSGQGEGSPTADNGTREGRAKNRRVEIRTK